MITLHGRNSVVVLGCLCFAFSCKDNTVLFNRGNPCPPYTKPSPSPYNSPVWHPGGQFIGFNYTPVRRISFPNGDSCEGFHEFITDSIGFWLMDPDGSNFRRILPDTLTTPAWSPDGMWLAFSRQVIGPTLFKMGFTGSGFDTTSQVQLTTSGSSSSPAWSPDGQWIAYESNDADPNGEFGIWKMRNDGSGRRKLSQPGSGEERRPHWSPDGASITYQRGLIGGIVEVFVMDTTGISSQRLTFDQRRNTSPKYSSGGDKIAFLTRGLTGTNDELVVTNSAGTSAPLQLAAGVATPFSWNTTGDQICYTAYHLRDYSYNNGTLWIADLNSLLNLQVTFNSERP